MNVSVLAHACGYCGKVSARLPLCDCPKNGILDLMWVEDGERSIAAERERCAKAICHKCRIGIQRQNGVAGNAKVVHFDGDDITGCAAEALFKLEEQTTTTKQVVGPRLDDKKLAEIEMRANKATAGPWVTCGTSVVRKVNEGSFEWMPNGRQGNIKNDGDFIAYAREDVPMLVAEVRRLQNIIIATQGALNEPHSGTERMVRIHTEAVKKILNAANE